MKSNLPDPGPKQGNAQAKEIAKVSGLYLVTAPGSAFDKVSKELGVAPVAFVWVTNQGLIRNVMIGSVIDPDKMPADIVFKGPVTLP